MSISVIPFLDESAAEILAAKAIQNQAKTKSTDTADFASTLDASTSALSASSAKVYSSEELDSIFDTAANTYGVSKDLLKSIAKAESNFNSSAVSSAGAIGVMQLMPSTAASLGVSNAYDAKENIMGGAKYISSLLTKYNGNTALALAAYNAGSSNVDKYGGIPPFSETQNYVSKVLGYMGESTASSTIFDLNGSDRDQANSMIESFLSSKNITKDSLDLMVALLKL